MYSAINEMSLSSYFNFAPLEVLNSNALALDFPNDYADCCYGGPCYESENFSYPQLYNDSVLPCFPSVCDGFISASSDLLPYQDFDVYARLKRRKFPENEFFLDIAPTLYDGFVQNVSFVPEFQVPEVASIENGKRDEQKYVSAQINVARERRRKITEKTRELGNLVPRGSRTNTAEMLHVA